MSKTWSGIYLLGTATVVTILVAIAGCTKTTTLPPPIGTVNPPPGPGGAALVVTDSHSSGSLTGGFAVFLPSDSGTTAPQAAVHGSNTNLREVKAVARDSRGNFYLGSNQDSAITCDPSPTAPPGSFTGRLAQGHIVIFDRTATGNVLPAATIEGTSNTTLDDSINGIAVDASFNIFVSQDDSTTDFQCPNGDSSSNGNHTARIMVFSGVGVSGDIAPTSWIAGTNTHLIEPDQLTFDPNNSGLLWTADTDAHDIEAFNVSGLSLGENNNSPVHRIFRTAAFTNPNGVTLDSAGNLYVTDNGSQIDKFTAAQIAGCGASCTLTPSHVITTLASENWSHIGTDGTNLFVTVEESEPNIEIFPIGATGLTAPTFIFDSSGTLVEAKGLSM